MSIMPRVTMKGGTPKKVIRPPVMPPMAAEAQRAPRQAKVIPMAVASRAPPTSRISRQARTAEKAIRLPTERSIPPEMMTVVIPMAMMAMTAIWLVMLSKLSRLRKLGQR